MKTEFLPTLEIIKQITLYLCIILFSPIWIPLILLFFVYLTLRGLYKKIKGAEETEEKVIVGEKTWEINYKDIKINFEAIPDEDFDYEKYNVPNDPDKYYFYKISKSSHKLSELDNKIFFNNQISKDNYLYLIAFDENTKNMACIKYNLDTFKIDKQIPLSAERWQLKEYKSGLFVYRNAGFFRIEFQEV
jgi:hypothetical protein